MAFNLFIQFIFHTGGILILMFMFPPIYTALAYDSGLYDDLSAEKQALADYFYSWGIILGVVAMGANVVWLYRAVQRKNAEEQIF